MSDSIFNYPGAGKGAELLPGNDLLSDVVSLWHMNSDWLDAVGDNNGTRAGSGSEFDTVDQQLGTAAGLFNGTDDEVNVGDDPSLIFGASDFSISVWTKLNVALGSSATNYHIISNELFESYGYMFRIGDASGAGWGRIIFRTSQSGASSLVQTATQVYPDDQAWHHLVFAKISGVGKIYLDNVEVKSEAVTDPVDSAIDTIIAGSAQRFKGSLDELIIFDKGLSVPEIAALYDEQTNGVQVTIPAFEELPVDRIPDKFQSAQVTPGGAIDSQDLGLAVTHIKINTALISSAKYDELLSFFQNTLNFMERTFQYTDALSTVYSNARLPKPSWYLSRVTNNSDAQYKGSFLMKTDPV